MVLAIEVGDAGADEDSNGDRDAEIEGLIGQAIAARDRAADAVPSASGRGTYKVTVIGKTMEVIRTERASFDMARSGACQFFQFRYENGAGHEDPDVYARVVLSDGETVYESRFCQRIRPTGAEAIAHREFEPGALQPWVWISGNLADYYSFVDRLLIDQDAALSLRDENDVKVVTSTKDGATTEFWIDPRMDFHIVRYRLVVDSDKTPLVLTDVLKEWKHEQQLWFVHRCLVRDKSHKDGNVLQTEETELVFDVFEPNVEVPRDVFTVHALGLPNDSPIWSGDSRDARTRFVRDATIDLSEVEKVVGKLPMALPAK